MTKLHQLSEWGQSIWYDNLRRMLIQTGELQRLIDEGVRGVTSNPTIFEKAITGSADYDASLEQLVSAQKSTNEIYEALVLDDIAHTADLLRPLYDATGGADGYVSLEVSPTLAHDTAGTLAEAQRLWAALDRRNVMIKVPATPEGIPAFQTLIANGINVNVTLIFSVAHYEAVSEAYIAGLEQRLEAGGDLHQIASVASFFVSRVDTAVDLELAQLGEDKSEEIAALQGKAAIANVKLAYARSQEIFSTSRWQHLQQHGARAQRPLWASTGTKNPNYPDTLYIDSLIGPNTVNTAPPATITAFLDHGTVAPTLQQGLDQTQATLAQLHDLGIDLDAITQQLQDEGVAAFATSFETLMASIDDKRARLLARQQNDTASLGSYQTAVDTALHDLKANRIVQRIWAHDHTVWQPDPTEITNRLGWLHSPDTMPHAMPVIQDLVASVRADGYTNALLLGMGGSSLAPEVFRTTFGVAPGFLELAVLDSTDPGAVLAHAERLDPATTLFIVSTKSGGTVETFSFFKYFYNRVAEVLGVEQAGQHFVAITDPGSGLVDTARQYDFRTTFLNDPDIGGRYSALSFFGLVPAALIGVDIGAILDRAATMAVNADGCNYPVDGDNRSAWLGAIMGELAMAGRTKLTIIASPPLASFGAWAEQLIAESTGKQGTGILPVADEPLGAPGVYGADRLFVYLRLRDDATHDAQIAALRDAGQPVVQIEIDDLYDVGGEFFRWELATAITGRRLGINPFDQPNVESAKILAREMVTAYQQQGQLAELTPTLHDHGITVYGSTGAQHLDQALNDFLGQAQGGDYIALQAYIQPTDATTEALQQFRTRLRDQTRLATTLGYGPRFLHSTGQLHKGDSGNGLFIQITADDATDLPIPDAAGAPQSSISFGILKATQALGDRQALLNTQRRVVRFHLHNDILGGIERLTEHLS